MSSRVTLTSTFCTATTIVNMFLHPIYYHAKRHLEVSNTGDETYERLIFKAARPGFMLSAEFLFT